MQSDEISNLKRLDFLRVAAVFVVVLTHVSSFVMGKSLPLTSFNWWMSNLVVSCGRWCIPVFVMISGALLLDPSRNDEPMRFYKNRMRRVAIPLVFWSLFYIVLRYAKGGFTAEQAVRAVASGEPAYHLWFLYMLLGLYLLTPFLRTYVKQATSRERCWLIVLIFILSNCYYFVNSMVFKNQQSVFTSFIPYLAYYLCGYEIRKLKFQEITFRYFGSAFIICVLAITIGTGAFAKLFGVQRNMFYHYLEPLVVVMSLIVFIAVYHGHYSSISENRLVVKFVEKLVPAVFGIYLLHVIVLEIITDMIGEGIMSDYAFVMIPAVTIATIFLCYVIVLFLSGVHVFQPIIGFDGRSSSTKLGNILVNINLKQLEPTVIESTLKEKTG